MRMPGIQLAASVDCMALMPPLTAQTAEVESNKEALKLLVRC